MSLGAGAVYTRNLPAANAYAIDPIRFAVLTSRNRKQYAQQAWPGYGGKVTQRIDKVGIVSRLHVYFTGTLAPGAMTPTATGAYPWNLISRLKVSANGISNLFYCDGIDLRALMRVRRGFLFDRESTFVLPTGGGATLNLKLHWEVPLSFDESLVGAVFAQTEDNELAVEIETPGAAADLFATNAPTVAGNFIVAAEFFSIPYEDSKEGRRLVLPDIRQLHGVVAKDDSLTGTGEHRVSLMRTGGILVRAMQRLDNAYPSAGATDPATAVDSHKFRYGSNIVPLDLSGAIVRVANQFDFGDAVLPAADVVSGGTAPRYMVDDFVKANPIRDVVHLLGVSEPELINLIASGTVINAGAKVHTLQEHMVAG